MKYIVIFLCLSSCCLARQLPSFIEVCKPKQTDVSSCILKNIEILRPKLKQKEGVVEMAIPSLHPMVIPLANIKLGEFEAILKDIKLWQVDEFQVKKLQVDLGDKVGIDLKLQFPAVNVEADYKVKGNFLILKLDGTGPCQINLTNLQANVLAVGEKETRNNKQYIVLKSFEIKPEVGHLDILLENLFPENEELTNNANKILNSNQNVVVEEFSPLVVNVIKEFITSLVSNIFNHYSYDILFPDD